MKSKLRLTGFYIAIGLTVYGLVGALLNDIYIPGRRTGGRHFHYEAIAPLLLAITLHAFTYPLDHFRQSVKIELTRRLLNAGALIGLITAFYFGLFPSGKRIATTQECQATIAKLEAFAAPSSGQDDTTSAFFRDRAAQCTSTPMLKSYHDCVKKAQAPTGINDCHSESEALFRRRNSTRTGLD